jgi:multidrug efflux pump subunit AcrA (membrane-fusion protein)
VRARVDGFVARPLKRPGEPVAAGEAVVLLDDADLLLDRDRCRARAEAAAQRCAAARADLRALEQKREHLRALHATRTAAAYELTQTQAEVEAAAARVKALDEERKEASSEGVALERRIGCCRCAAQGAGTLGELLRGAGDYVRTGDPVAVVHSPRRQVRVLLPSATCRGAAAFSFALAWNGEWQALLPSLTEGPQAELSQAERSVALEIPAGVDLQIGQTVDVEVVAP